MIINMLRLEDRRPSDIVKLSFKQFLCERSIPKLQEKERLLETEIANCCIENEEMMEKYLKGQKQLGDLRVFVWILLGQECESSETLLGPNNS